MVASIIDRVISRSCDQYQLDKSSKDLIQKYIESTVSEVVKKCEQKAKKIGFKKKHIGSTITYEVCEEILITPISFSPSSLKKGLKEEEKQVGYRYETIPERPEVA